MSDHCPVCHVLAEHTVTHHGEDVENGGTLIIRIYVPCGHQWPPVPKGLVTMTTYEDALYAEVKAAPHQRIRREDRRPLAYGWCPVCHGEFYSVFEAWLDEHGRLTAEGGLHCDGCARHSVALP